MTAVEARAGIAGRFWGSRGGLALGETTTTGSAASSWARAESVKKIVAASGHSVGLSRMGDPSPAVVQGIRGEGWYPEPAPGSREVDPSGVSPLRFRVGRGSWEGEAPAEPLAAGSAGASPSPFAKTEA